MHTRIKESLEATNNVWKNQSPQILNDIEKYVTSQITLIREGLLNCENVLPSVLPYEV
jgi:hypothetical protein